MDTDSLDPSAIRETVTSTEQLLSAVADGVPFKVVYCIPEIEAIFFEAPIDLKRIFPLYDEHFFLMYAKTRPKEALNYLLENGGGPKTLSAFLDQLTLEDIGRLRTTYQIGQLIGFANEVRSRVAQAAS
jgi:hypothetical protein